MLNAIYDFLSTEGFQPHGLCLLWRSDVFWAHVISDAVTALAYFTIPAALVVFSLRRPDLVHRGVLYLFVAFIVACGITHLFGLWTLWVPDYGIQAIAKALTASVSVAAAVALWKLMPVFVTLPSPKQLEANNARLAREVAERKAAEARLADLNACLERRVTERTTSLGPRQRGAARGPRPRRAGERGQVGVPRRDEPRDPHADERRARHDSTCCCHEALRRPSSAATSASPAAPAHALLTVINDILDYSRLEAGSLELEAVEFDPADQVAEKVVELLGEGAGQGRRAACRVGARPAAARGRRPDAAAPGAVQPASATR